jgi:hypothetical protein
MPAITEAMFRRSWKMSIEAGKKNDVPYIKDNDPKDLD